MFSFEPSTSSVAAAAAATAPVKPRVSPKNMYPSHTTYTPINEVTLNAIDGILDRERNHNKTESWNKLDKTVKLQKLAAFAEKYGKDHGMPPKTIKQLKLFFVECLEKNKLQKTKDLFYDKELSEITGIPALHFAAGGHHFTLKNLDAKRVSTLKSLTPKEFSKTASFTTRPTESAVAVGEVVDEVNEN